MESANVINSSLENWSNEYKRLILRKYRQVPISYDFAMSMEQNVRFLYGSSAKKGQGSYYYHIGDHVIDFFEYDRFPDKAHNAPMDELASALILMPSPEARLLFLKSI